MNAVQLTKKDGTRFFVTVNSISAVEELKTRDGFYAVVYIANTKTTVMESYNMVLNRVFGIINMSCNEIKTID